MIYRIEKLWENLKKLIFWKDKQNLQPPNYTKNKKREDSNRQNKDRGMPQGKKSRNKLLQKKLYANKLDILEEMSNFLGT